MLVKGGTGRMPHILTWSSLVSFCGIHQGHGLAQCTLFNKSVLGNTDLDFYSVKHYCNNSGKVKLSISY